ncbi:Cholecystokinin receptor [Chionoecetes opilio]|uniref:Cholecystokinin receptor n=1 Tax=Chionoecetes opilio TaxID=41210 RepID=A0A8J4Y2P3_CHIOP|nr:Cholecystokinin receptor [Chionoecetes opilio]
MRVRMREMCKDNMFMCVMLAMTLTSASSFMTLCVPVMSLVKMISLPVAAAAEGTTRPLPLNTREGNTLSPSSYTPLVIPSPLFYPSHSPPLVPTSFLSSGTYPPSNPPGRRISSSTPLSTSEDKRNSPASAVKGPENISISWAPENPFEDHLNDSASFMSACVLQDGPGGSNDTNTTCGPHSSNRSRQAGRLVGGLEWVRIVGFSLIFVVGVVGNVLVVVTLLHHHNLRSLTNVFLLNLAVSDLLLGVFCMPFTLIGSLLQDFVFGALMCRLIPYMQAVSVSVSVWTLVAISLERFYAICQPLRSRRWQTPSHAYRVIAGVWVASLLLMTPIAALSTLMPVRGHPGRHKCREVWVSREAERTFSILLTALLLLVPLVVMAAAYLRMVRTLWLGSHLPGAAMNAEDSLRAGGAACSEGDGGPPRLLGVSIRFRRGLSRREREVPSIHPEHQARENTDSRSSPEQVAAGATPHVLTTRLEQHGCCGSGDGVPPRSTSGKWEGEGGARWRPLRSSQAQRSLVAKRRVVRMLFVLVAEFFICWTPLFLVNLLSLYIRRQVYAALGSFGVSLVQLLAYLSSCCNPLTYCFMNAKFIQSFKLAFACTRRRPPASLRGVAVARSFHTMSLRCPHDPAPRRPPPRLSSPCRNGATHDTALQGTGV